MSSQENGMRDYDGLVALVTGGASGIGAAVVRELATPPSPPSWIGSDGSTSW